MLFDKIIKRYKEMAKTENKQADKINFQYGDGGIEMQITKNGKIKNIKEQ